MDSLEIEVELWRRFKVDNDLVARDYLLTEYSPWVASVVMTVLRRAGSRDLDWSDHMQNGHLGLLEAMNRYQPQKGVPFQLYAKARVRGAVFNGIRASAKSQRYPKDLVLLEVADRDEEDAFSEFISAVVGIALDEMVEQAADARCEGESLQQAQNGKLIKNVLLGMPDNIRAIFVSHYYLHQPFVRIAEDLCLSKGRISQLHSKGLGMFKSYLADHGYAKSDFI
ncbi:RNA polymerase sigma-D factor [Xanthomonas sacchari]|uniref:sigma-70 family RNA polymerase sigma factor n=1 Tax=Xanthomonas TaxID=338 RepID=UPI00225E3BB7|nr:MULTISPECIES: sigma-70 family RNA polymerase sigma factor [Xanthomonas]MCW0460028.1 RNA polymerase sigma-D factor [Xanthomonas sacchari]MDY4297327.1 sigma-70 family RNA polymerase sigma factor [Xanthomonas sp. LF02-5]MDY4359121.1 sigma-70 family RNA polymerase sigma factor [Xanthomonas sp. LF04-12]